MRQILFIFSLGIVFLLVLVNYTATYVPANTYLSSHNLGCQKTKAFLDYLAKQKDAKIRIKVNGRVYLFSYNKLGVIFDLNTTYSNITKQSQLPVLSRFRTYAKSFNSKAAFVPQFIFTQDYFERIKNLEFDFTKNSDQITVNPKNKQLTYDSYQERFVIDPLSLQKEIIANFGKNNILEPQLHRVFNNDTKLRVETYNQKIGQIFYKPLKLVYEKSDKVIAELSGNDLRSLLSVDYNQENQVLSVGVDDSMLSAKTMQLANNLSLGSDLQLDKQDFRNNLVALINSRFNGNSSNYVYLRLIEKPNTSGIEANKYIEIDISQQKMYLWENNNNFARYSISSGLYYPTPPGKYKILNKANNAYSDIYHVWMPYWMAFSLDPKVNAYLGIHELPYWVDNNGKTIRRPRDFIGSPHTGGCVSLDVGMAKIVYDWADEGMPVLIYD